MGGGRPLSRLPDRTDGAISCPGHDHSDRAARVDCRPGLDGRRSRAGHSQYRHRHPGDRRSHARPVRHAPGRDLPDAERRRVIPAAADRAGGQPAALRPDARAACRRELPGHCRAGVRADPVARRLPGPGCGPARPGADSPIPTLAGGGGRRGRGDLHPGPGDRDPNRARFELFRPGQHTRRPGALVEGDAAAATGSSRLWRRPLRLRDPARTLLERDPRRPVHLSA